MGLATSALRVCKACGAHHQAHVFVVEGGLLGGAEGGEALHRHGLTRHARHAARLKNPNQHRHNRSAKYLLCLSAALN